MQYVGSGSSWQCEGSFVANALHIGSTQRLAFELAIAMQSRSAAGQREGSFVMYALHLC